MKSYDPRPLSRAADLAARKTEYDADTASINRRTMQMNADAQRKYAQQMAAQAKPKAPAREPAKANEGWLARGMTGMRRRMVGVSQRR